MTFTASTYVNLVTESSAAQSRLFLQYAGPRDDFDIIVVGSGMGGGVLADDLADRVGRRTRILVLEAGSFLYPTHVYNFSRLPNSALAKHFGCDTFWQAGGPDSSHYIGEKPQLNFGGRSIFWSGLIPTIQDWELDFFPPRVRGDLASGLLDSAGDAMNESRTMGRTAQEIVTRLRSSPLGRDFSIHETPRALHQPYLTPDGTPRDQFFTEPTGVFNTAELLVNQLGLTPGVSHGDHEGLQLLLNHYVEDVRDHRDHLEVVTRSTLDGSVRHFRAPRVVLCAGSIESPKLLRRSSTFDALPDGSRDLVGRGLTDHPTSSEIATQVTHLGDVPIPRTDHAKIILYSRGLLDGAELRFPFNVEMNVNHEYWHLRENDPGRDDDGSPAAAPAPGASRVDLKFSFANPLDDGNEIRRAPDFGYVPEVVFRNSSWMDHLTTSRLPAVAGWHRTADEVFDVMNEVTGRILAEFSLDGQPARPDGGVWFGQGGKGFGWGTVHHAAGTLRMPWRTHRGAAFDDASVVDEDLHVTGTSGLHVCDMSVMPVSTAANPVRTLVALALRLSRHLA